jgi:glycosyltransferase involved in cell wall biosynthesis
VLLLAPSRGLGGGIERYVATIEDAFARQAVGYRRFDLRRPGGPGGPRRKLGFVREVSGAVRAAPGPVRLVLAHRNLLPVVPVAARQRNFAAATVIFHGSEIWSGRRSRGARVMSRPDVRVVAASSFSAGALAGICPAAVLHPGVPAGWYRQLVAAGERARPGGGEVALVTAFRLASWRSKGLETVLRAIQLLDRDRDRDRDRDLNRNRVRLTVCGAGPVPPELAAVAARYPWCRVRPDLTDQELAGQLAGADLFVLGTRTRSGPAASGEGFGLVLLEAQLAGTPVIAPAYGGSHDAYQPGVTGLAPPDESPEALAAVLSTMLRDGVRRDRMARAAAAWSRGRFEPASYSEHLVERLLGPAQPARENGG